MAILDAESLVGKNFKLFGFPSELAINIWTTRGLFSPNYYKNKVKLATFKWATCTCKKQRLQKSNADEFW